MNYMGIACGVPGSGKSYAVITVAEAIDKGFCAERIAFTPEEFLEIIQDKNLKSGSALVFEEVGVGISARDWYSISNKLVNAVFQTFRLRQLVVMFNTPSMIYIDSNARLLFHGYMEPVHIDFRREICTVKYMSMEYNPRDPRRKIYYHYLKEGNSQIKRIEIPKPSTEIIDEYEEKKRKFAHGLIDSALDEIKNLREGGKVTERDSPNAICPYCNYRWVSKRNKKKIQCPGCFKLIPNPNFIKFDK
jgi:hypothetical protein